MALFRLIPCAGERDPIGCWVQRWHRHRLVLSQRWNFLSIEGTWQVGGSNQVESIQTRHFCYASSGKKRRELFFLSLPFSFLIFSSVRNYCCGIRERTETSQRQIFFYTGISLERDVKIRQIDWISTNRVAIALNDIEIWEIDEEGETSNSRVIKQFKHEDASVRISTILQFCYQFLLFFCWSVR